MSVKQLLTQIALQPSKKLGQNFLIDSALAKNIVEHLQLQKTDRVLEIGPGLGALTKALLQTQEVIAVEKSKQLFLFLQKTFSDQKHVSFYHCDILKFDLQLLQANVKYKVVSNLPYCSATQILKFFLPQNHLFDCLYFSFPSDVANKILVSTNSKGNSFLSIFVSLFSFVEKVLFLEASSFYPKPKVDSIFLLFKLRQQKLFQHQQKQEQFLNFVGYCFLHRRKTLINNLRERYNLSNAQLKLLSSFLINRHDSDQIRAQSLNLEHFLALFEYFYHFFPLT